MTFREPHAALLSMAAALVVSGYLLSLAGANVVEILWWLVLILSAIGFAILAVFLAVAVAFWRDINRSRRPR